MRKIIQTECAPLPIGAYSQGILSPTGTLYISSQMPQNPKNRKIPTGIESQTHQLLKNISEILKSGNLTMDNVMKVTVYLTDEENFSEFNKVYIKYFNQPYPARSVIICPLEDELIEMDIIAE